MWLLNFLPDWVFYVVGSAGLIGLFSSYLLRFIPIPSINVYKIPIQLVSIVLIVFATYMFGGIANEEQWNARVEEVEAKVAMAEVESVKQNVQILEKVVKKTEYITRKGEEVIQYVDREIVKYDSSCVIPKEFIKAHNDATELNK
jgi:uncharacterized membrane protein